MPLTIALPSILARLADGQRALSASGTTVGDAVADVTRRFPSLAARLVDDAGHPYPFVTFYLNDEDIRFAGGAVPRRGGHRDARARRLRHRRSHEPAAPVVARNARHRTPEARLCAR